MSDYLIPFPEALEYIRKRALAYGVTKLAREIGVGRRTLYKALRLEGNPKFRTLYKATEILGIKLLIKPYKE